MPKRSQFHVHLEVKSRSKGQSAAASIAYITASCIQDVWKGERHNFQNRHGVVKYECFNFDGTVDELAALLDGTEKRGNSCVCRSLDVALPRGLNLETQWLLVSMIARTIAAYWNVAVAAALHLPSKDGDPRNAHGHFVFSTREIVTGRLTRKTRSLDEPISGPLEIRLLRAEISRLIIEMLVSLGRKNEAEIWDFRSYEERGISLVPGKHRGPRETRKRRRVEKLKRQCVQAEIDAMIAIEDNISTERMISGIVDELTTRMPPVRPSTSKEAAGPD